jgi:hypothetical protein
LTRSCGYTPGGGSPKDREICLSAAPSNPADFGLSMNLDAAAVGAASISPRHRVMARKHPRLGVLARQAETK